MLVVKNNYMYHGDLISAKLCHTHKTTEIVDIFIIQNYNELSLYKSCRPAMWTILLYGYKTDHLLNLTAHRV